MIQNVTAPQSRQNFGMALKTEANFPKRLADAYARKSEKTITNILTGLTKAKEQQKDISKFDLYIGFDKKNRLKYEIQDNLNNKQIKLNPLAKAVLSLFPDNRKLDIISSSLVEHNKKYTDLLEIGKKIEKD